MLGLYLQGKKTYILGALMIIYAGVGYYLKQMNETQALQLVMTALGMFGLRKGITEDVTRLYKAIKTPEEPKVLPK